MAKKLPSNLTPAEWKVMQIIWRRKQCAARDVTLDAKSYEWSTSTVKTLLRRLVDKGHLTTTRVGNSFLYQPSTKPLGPLMAAADTLLKRAMDGTVGPLLAHMVKKSNLTPEEVAQLRKLLDSQVSREHASKEKSP